jgi:hypothetical protein
VGADAAVVWGGKDGKGGGQSERDCGKGRRHLKPRVSLKFLLSEIGVSYFVRSAHWAKLKSLTVKFIDLCAFDYIEILKFLL